MEQRANKKWDSMTQPFPKYIKFWWVFWRLGAGSRCLWAWSSTHQYVWKREEKEIIKFYSKSHGIDIMGPLIIISFILLFALLSSIWMVSLKSDLLRKIRFIKTMGFYPLYFHDHIDPWNSCSWNLADLGLAKVKFYYPFIPFVFCKIE